MMNVANKTRNFFIAFLSLTVFSACTNFIAFVSPYWIQSTAESNSQFKNIGLWTACFNGYMRPHMYDKAYFGCYYIYYVEYDRIRSWINPVWFYAIQVLSSCGMLVHSLVLFVVLCQTTNSIKRDNLQVAKFTLAGHFFVCLTLAASLVAFAIARYDSTWMPFPQFNVLSWSYSVAVLSFALTLISFLVGFVRYMYLDAVLDEYQMALLRQQADMDVSSPPMKERPAPLGYEPRQLSTAGVQDARYNNPHSYATGRTRDQDDEDVLDEEAANEDFDELSSEQMQDRDSNFNGLDPRLSGGSVYSDEQRPMIHHARS